MKRMRFTDGIRRLAFLLIVITASLPAMAAVNGDVNNDGEVTIADVNEVIEAILNNTHNTAADVNGDGEITVADANEVIDLILNKNQGQLISTILVTTRDGVTTEHLIDQNTRVSIEKPNLVIETDGKTHSYELESMAKLRYGKRYVLTTLYSPVIFQEESTTPDGDARPQYAIYTYRNDGGFDAFLNIDVDSITFSNTDTEGVTHTNAVVQQVWTSDSLYRIPLAAIDSVCFKAPATEYKPDVVIIDERHMPYIIEASDSTITFKSSVPSNLVPAIGQIMYSDLTDDPFYMGFAGRVVSIERNTSQIEYICEPVTPSDVYSQFLDFFKVITDTTEVVDDNNGPANAPSRSSWAFIATDGTVRIPEHKWEINFNLNKLFGGEGNIKDSGTIENEFYYLICVGMLDHDFITLKHTKTITNTATASFKYMKTSTSDELKEPLWGEPVSLVGCKYLGVNLYPGLFFDADASLELEAKLPYNSVQVDEYYFGSDVGWSNPIVTSDDKGGWPGLSDYFMSDDVSVKIKVSGKVAFGPIVKAAFVVWKPNSLSFDVRAKGGLELSGECSLDLTTIADDEQFDLYDDILSSIKITTGLKVGLELHGTVFGEDCTFASATTTLLKREKYLFPKFTAPALPQYNNGTWEGSVTPTSMFTVPSHELLLPGKVGLGIYDQDGTCLRSTYYDTWYFGTEENWSKNAVQCSMTGLDAGQEYVVRPLYKMLSLIPVKGGPTVVFFSPEPITLEKNSLQLIKGTRGDMAIYGGWGVYSASSSDDNVAKTTIISDWSSGKESFLVRVDAVSPGDATIKVKDVRSGDVVSFAVKVMEGQNLPLYVAEEDLNFGVVPAGTTRVKTLTFINNTSSAKTVKAVAEAPFSFQQGQSSVSSTTISVPGKSCGYVTVMFTSATPGNYRGNVTFTNDAFQNGQCVVPVQAYAASSNAPLYVEQQNLDLGEVPMGATRTGELTLVNTSTSPQTVTATVDAPFSFSQGESSVSSLSFQIPASTYSTITVLYTGTEFGTVNGNVTFTAEAFQDGRCIVPVQATTPSGSQSLYVEQQSLDLGDVLIGETRTGELSIVNNTMAAKTLTCSVDSPFWFKQGESCVSSKTVVIPGNSCGSVTVMFTATTLGDYSGYITFKNATFDGGQCLIPVQVRAVDSYSSQTEVIPVGNVSLTMVTVEGGTFMMGAPDSDDEAWSGERPVHQVTVSSFAIGQTEVTQALWMEVMGSNPSEFTGDLNRPVECVSWNDCQTFIAKLNQRTGRAFRLPTEAEWEFATRGGTKSRGYKYSGSNNVDAVAWYWDNIPSQTEGAAGFGTQPVGTKSPNELGLYDMSGNVWEWVQDWWSYFGSEAQTNPTGPVSGSYRVYRGGGWGSTSDGCRVSHRYGTGPSYTHRAMGLRLAL